MASKLTDELDTIEQESAALKQRIENSMNKAKKDINE